VRSASYPTKLEPRPHVERRPPGELAAPRDRLDHAHRSRPHREHAHCCLDPAPGLTRHRIALPVQRVVFQTVGSHRSKRVEADVQRHPHVVESAQKLGREVEPRGRRRRRACVARVHGLIPLGILQRLVDVWRQWHLTRGLPLQAQQPPAVSEGLDQLDRPESLARAQPPRRSRERFPHAVPLAPLEEQDLDLAAALAPEWEPRGNDTRVVEDDELALEDLG
jgi:hypothetical protein